MVRQIYNNTSLDDASHTITRHFREKRLRLAFTFIFIKAAYITKSVRHYLNMHLKDKSFRDKFC